ncbi:uncharacterized protein LOC143296727 [Babylonia areolata]|uniref:uncharacterized protein LOC143296727 n=1 Tax=Babylonia areolata TaxID=304850 RepID=UPI003FD152F6
MSPLTCQVGGGGGGGGGGGARAARREEGSGGGRGGGGGRRGGRGHRGEKGEEDVDGDWEGGEGERAEEEEEEDEETLSFVFGRPAHSSASASSPAAVVACKGRCLSPPLLSPTSGSRLTPPPSYPASREPLPVRRTASAGCGGGGGGGEGRRGGRGGVGMVLREVVEREVLSSPTVSSPSSSSSLGGCWGGGGEGGGVVEGGVCCEQCHACLVDLKRQALRLMFPDSSSGACLAQTVRLDGLEERLAVGPGLAALYRAGHCTVCQTPVGHLKEEAVAMIRSIQVAQTAATTLPATCLPALVGSCTPQHRFGRKGQTFTPGGHSSLPLAAQAQAYLDHNVPRAWLGLDDCQPTTAASVAPPTPTTPTAPHPHHHHAADDINATSDHLGGARSHPHHHSHPHPQQQQQQQQQHPSYPATGRPPLPVFGTYHTPGRSSSSSSICKINSNNSSGGGGGAGGGGLASRGSRAGSLPPPTVSSSPSPGHQVSGHGHGHGHGHGPRRGGSLSPPAPSPSSPSSAISPPPNSAAVSFFHRAAQKLSKKKRRQSEKSQEADLPVYPTCYGQVVRLTPPPAPPGLLRALGRLQNPGVGKVKVMLRVSAVPGSQGETAGARFLSVDPHRKQITVFDPSASGYVTSAHRRAGIAAPKMFGFDAVFSPDDSLTELCAASLSEIVQAVVNGADGCLFTYGYSKTGKTHSMLGTDQSGATLGVMPCAIAWLFKLINEQKDRTGARFSVRVSAVEVTGKNENLRDLLADVAQGTEAAGVGTAPGVYLREDPICGTQLENQSELRAPSADKAALYLDAALATRSPPEEEEGRCSHLLFTLNVYQYRIEKANRAGLPGVAGGRSRLHLIDLGSASKSRDPNNVSLSLSALGNVIMALLNGQRHVPHRDSKISQLLRDSLGNVTCRTCMLAHVSSAVPHFNETLQVIQLAARIHRMKRRRTKFSSTSSEDSSTDESGKFRRPYRGLRMGTLREDVLYSSSHSDPDYTSSSEQSCDTVIYLGANGQSLSDRELTDHEGPPRHVPRTNPRLPRRPSGSRSSGDDSDSGRSRASDVTSPPRYGPRPAMGMRTGGGGGGGGAGSPAAVSMARVQPLPHVISAPGSPAPGAAAQLKVAHHRMALHHHGGAKGGVGGGGGAKPGGVGGESSGHWPDKVSKHRAKPLDTASEQWVDGPGAAIYPESGATAEQWVDGPPAFLLQSEPPQHLHHPHPHQQHQPSLTPQQGVVPQSPSHRGDTARRLKNRKVEAEEQWVDGPREMMMTSGSTGAAGNSSTTTAPSLPLHTTTSSGNSMGEPTPAPPLGGRAVVGQPSQAPKLSTAVSDKALKQALIKHLERERPDTTTTLDSHVADDAAQCGGGGVGGGEGVCRLSCHHHHQQHQQPCQWDRRQAGDGVSVAGMDFVSEDADKNQTAADLACSSSAPSSSSLHRRHHPHKDHHHLSKRLLSAKHSSSSLTSSPKPSPASARKAAAVGETTPAGRLQRSDLPGASASPTHRVAQWIKSVTRSDAAVSEVEAAQVTSGLPSATDVTMADAETNTEHDSDFERLADCDEAQLPEDSGVVGVVGVVGEGVGGVCSAVTDAGQDNHNTGSSGDGGGGDISGPPVRYETLYEHIVEEQQLENVSSRKDRGHLAKDMDNETFSSQSAPRDTLDSDRQEPRVGVAAAEEVGVVGKKDAGAVEGHHHHPHHLQPGAKSAVSSSQCRGAATTSARASSGDLAAVLLPADLSSKPLLSRKPDGASNPHLNQEFPEDECSAVLTGEQQQCVSAQYAALCPPPAPTDIVGFGAKDYTGSTTHMAADTAVALSLSDKVAAQCNNNKPSLPQKAANTTAASSSSSSSPKANSLSNNNKLTAVSSCCSSSAPPSGVPLPSPSPKAVGGKETPSPAAGQKQASPKTSLLCNGRKEKGGKGGKEKAAPASSPSTTSTSGKGGGGGGGKSGGKGTGGCKLPVFSGGKSTSSSSPSPKDGKLRKKEKENAKTGRLTNGKYSDISLLQQQQQQQHSSKDITSGVVGGGGRQEKRLLSPYATVTQPKPNTHSSSGHGSDNSSTISTEVHSQPSSKCDKLHHGGTSSGYESMLRESEETASSSSSSSSSSTARAGGGNGGSGRHGEDSGAEQSADRKKGSKRKGGTKRSRSAPARSSESPSTSTGGGSQGSRVWVDPRHAAHGHALKVKDEPLELKRYEVEDVERLQRRRQDDATEGRASSGQRAGGRDVQTRQPGALEITDSKDRISLHDSSGWGLDCKFLFCFCSKSRPVKGTEV